MSIDDWNGVELCRYRAEREWTVRSTHKECLLFSSWKQDAICKTDCSNILCLIKLGCQCYLAVVVISQIKVQWEEKACLEKVRLCKFVSALYVHFLDPHSIQFAVFECFVKNIYEQAGCFSSSPSTLTFAVVGKTPWSMESLWNLSHVALLLHAQLIYQ